MHGSAVPRSGFRVQGQSRKFGPWGENEKTNDCFGGYCYHLHRRIRSLRASIKERNWQEGKLIDISTEPYTYGSVYKGTGGIHQGEQITYLIDDGKYIYAASHTHRRHDKALPVTVNAKIKFAVEKSKVYILDEENEEHELKFVKKTLKDAAKEKQP